MAQTIQLKRSSVAGNKPGASDLALGEIAINTADGAVYIKKGDGTIVAVHDNDILHIDTTNGRIGINTTSPLYALQVGGSIYSNAGHLYLDSGRRLNWGNSQQFIEGTNSYGLEFGAGNAVKAFLTNDGKLGVNTTTVNYRLTVNQVNSTGTGTLGFVPDSSP